MACGRCGSKRFNGRKYPTLVGYTTEDTDASVEIALVQFRYGIQVEIDDTPTNFYPGQVIYLSYPLIHLLVADNYDILYFHKDTDKYEFSMVYPELEGANV